MSRTNIDLDDPGVVMILTDTSAWIEYFRATGSTAAGEVRRLLATESERVVICEPIAMEIRAGALDEYCHAKRERLVDGLRSERYAVCG
ncbi:MAG: PIN domain-containing protein [Mycobacterium sp.]